MIDVIIIGAGPVGLACGIEAKRNGLSARLIEKGALLNSFLGYPTNMELFSTPDLLEIGGHPFPSHYYKPRREESIDYYRRVAEAEALDILLYERVLKLDGEAGDFVVHSDKDTYRCRQVVVCTGFFDIPNLMHVPGEDLAKVKHYYKEPFAYTGQDVAVIGAKNSAAKAALECYRHGARVTLVVRGPKIGPSVKYWIRPDIVNRIREGAVQAFFNTTVSAITPDALHLKTTDGPVALANDRVLAMTGYRPDYPFLESLGIATRDDTAHTPDHDPETFQTNRAGLYMAGTVCGGYNTSRWFIENGRFHAKQIMHHIAKHRGETVG